jgi:iron complex outermembrane receptor protein
MTLGPTTRLVAAEAEAAVAADTPSLEEITIHAQRRQENLQTVPITVDTVSGEDAAARGTSSMWTLVNTIPNLTFHTGGSATNTYIRGVGDNSVSPNNEPSVAVYVDGVYNASSLALTAFNFNNIEQLEVLKGPQGTLFGRNATAGVIQILTPDPKHDFHGKVDAGYGNYDTVDADAYFTGGLTEKLAADVSMIYHNQMDGFGTNFTDNTPTYKASWFEARSKWMYDASDATKIRFSLDYTNYDSGGLPDQFVPGSHPPYLGPFNVYGNSVYTDNMTYGASMRLDQDIGESLHGVSISSYRWVSGSKAIDSDFTSALLSEINNHFDSRYWTQELQLTNRNPGRITWLAGLFYYGNQVFGADPWLQTGSQIAGGYRSQSGVQNTASGSAFGQATADLGADTKLTLGLRYTYESLRVYGSTQNAAQQVIAGPFAQKITSDPLTWRVALDHQFTSDLLGYVSFNRGFKSGGFNLTSPGSAPFYPEHVDAYETGLKSEFLDHRVRLNVSGFYYRYSDLQVAISIGGAQLFENAARARNYGMDGNLDFAATDRLTLSAGLGLLNAKYVDYPNARGYTIMGAPFLIANAKGADLPFAPAITGFVSSNYRVPTAIGEFKGTANLSYNDKSYLTPDMGLERPAYWMLNLTLEWRPPVDQSWALRLWGKNLTNADYDLFATEGPQGWYRSQGAPRTYGLSVEKDF